MWDVAVIGAGLSGIVCARRLVSAGYSVCILDKSRGLGGRMATRRISEQQGNEQLRVDHGLRYWQAKSPGLQTLTEELVEAGVLKPWAASEYEIQQVGELKKIAPEATPKYVTKTGMSAVAKHLLQQAKSDGTLAFEQGKNLLTNHRVVSLRYQQTHWTIECARGEVVQAKRCAIAIPAPQAADLLTSCLQDEGAHSIQSSIEASIQQLESVSYFPCLTVMAGYKPQLSSQVHKPDPTGWMVCDKVGTSTDWVGLDSSKRGQTSDATHPVVVIHSKPDFAQRYLDTTDLQPAASVLLRANARKLGDWIAQPDWFQIHRWRYAQVRSPYSSPVLAVTDSLICGGDWCISPDTDGNVTSIDNAYSSGCALAKHLKK